MCDHLEILDDMDASLLTLDVKKDQQILKIIHSVLINQNTSFLLLAIDQIT